MQTYKYEKIRNVVVLGHGGCGKTTLVEAMAYVSGLTNRQGKIEDGNTISDYDKEEIKRKFSVSTTVVPVIWEDTKINLLDTPGYFDFVGEVEEAASVADAAVIVISAKAGIEAGTLKAWNLCEKLNLPRIFFVTDMDLDNTSFRTVVENLQELYGKRIAPFQSPIREHETFVGFVNIVKMEGRRFIDNNKYEDGPIPDYTLDYVNKYRDALLEAIAESNEEMLEKYFGGEEFTPQEISTALRSSVKDGKIVPVFMGSSLNARGARMLLQDIVKYFPSPNKEVITGTEYNKKTNFAADYDANKSFSAKVFKTIVDPFVGKFSLIKVCSGILHNDDVIFNAELGTEEKLSKLYVLRGKEQIEVNELYAGDIGAIAKLSNTYTGDSLSTKDCPIVFARPKLTTPYTYRKYTAANKNEVDKISQGFSRLMEEDLTIKIVNDSANQQLLLYGIGDQHLEIIASKLKERYKVEINLSKPNIPYRETIKKQVTIQGKYKKQSGGHGQYGDVHIIFEPLADFDTPYVFEEKVFGGAIPKNYFPAVEKGIAEGVLSGPLSGYPVVGIKAILVDGSYHPVDSSEMAFKMATLQAFKDGIMKAEPYMLEPIVLLSVIVPDKYTGDIMGDLNKRRGRILGMTPNYNKWQEISCEIPLSELYDYSTALRSTTGGLGEYSYEIVRYEQMLPEIQKKVLEAK